MENNGGLTAPGEGIFSGAEQVSGAAEMLGAQEVEMAGGERDTGRGEQGQEQAEKQTGHGDVQELGRETVMMSEMQPELMKPIYGDANATRTEVNGKLIGTDTDKIMLSGDTITKEAVGKVKVALRELNDDPAKMNEKIRKLATDFVRDNFGRIAGDRNDGSGTELDFLQERKTA